MRLLNSTSHIFSIVLLSLGVATQLWAQTMLPEGTSVVRVGGDWGYPPFEYLDEFDQPAGFNIDIVRKIAEVTGLKLQIQLTAWTLARSSLESGSIDMLSGMYRSDDRLTVVDFALPHFVMTYGVFARKGSGILGPADLNGKRIAVQKNDLGHEFLLKKGLESNLVVVTEWKDIFEAVRRGEADCAVASLLQGGRAIKDPAFSAIRAVGASLFRAEYCLAVRKGDEKLLALLNEGLSIMRTSGAYEEIYRRWFGDLELIDTDDRIIGVLAAVFGVAVTITMTALLWVATIRTRVHQIQGKLSTELKHHAETQSRLQEALSDAESAKKKAQSEAREKTAFVACLGQELRTPLHGVLGATELLGGTALDADQARSLSMARSSAEQIRRVLSDLLDAVGAEQGGLDIEPVDFDYKEFANWIESLLRPPAEERGLAFRFSAEGRECRLHADKNRFAQVIINLGTNAISYTERGDVEIHLRLDEDSLYISVKDTGPGMSVETKERVFMPVYRSSSDGNASKRGLGLGLSIVKSIVDALDGSIRFETHQSMGTRFEVSLPVTASVAPADVAPRDRAEAVVELPEPPVTDTQKRAIVAEDEAINRLYLKRVLEGKGFEVAQAIDGQAALSVAVGGFWDFILMDVSMPRMDGLEATRRIRKLEAEQGTRRVPIIALTAHAYAEDREACAQAGMDGFLSKPYTESALWAEVARTIAKVGIKGHH